MFKVVFVFFVSTTSFFTMSAKEQLNLQQMVKRFVETSTVIQAAEAQKQSVLASARKAGSGFFPTVNLVGSKTATKYAESAAVNGFSLDDTTAYSMGLEWQQNLYAGGAVLQKYRQQKVLAEKAKVDFFGQKNQAIAVVVSAALEWLAAKEQLRVLRSSVVRQKKFVAVTRKRQERGAALSFELAQAEAEEISYGPRIEGLLRIKFDKEKQLQTALELPEIPEINFNWPELITLPEKSAAQWVKIAHEVRWDHISAMLDVKSAEAGKWLALSAELPSLYLAGAYTYQNTEFKELVADENQRKVFSVNLSVPLFSGLSSVHQRRASQELITVAKRNLKRVKQDIVAEIGRYYKNLSSTGLQVEQARLWAQRASEAMRLGDKSYRVGRISSVQWLQLQRGLESAELGRTQALQINQLAVLQWQMALGVDLESFYASLKI